MTKTLPSFIELRRNGTAGAWFVVCKACGVKEGYDSFWLASEAAHGHADVELQAEDEKRAGS